MEILRPGLPRPPLLRVLGADTYTCQACGCVFHLQAADQTEMVIRGDLCATLVACPQEGCGACVTLRAQRLPADRMSAMERMGVQIDHAHYVPEFLLRSQLEGSDQPDLAAPPEQTR